MSSPSPCPRPADLQSLLLGQLSGPEAEQLEQHFADCPRCSELVHTLRAEDTLADAVRGAGGPVQDPEQPVVEGLIQKIKQLRPTGSGGEATPSMTDGAERPEAGNGSAAATTQPAEAGAGDGAQELYDFLAPAQGPEELGRLGSYRVFRVLGAGGMGVVFEAEDIHLQRRVALKAMLPTLAASASARQRFLREARSAAAIEHDHIVPIYQVGEDRNIPFVAMPLLKGQSLEECLRRSPRLPIPECLRIGREIAEGLSAAHERGLIHRDIKPDNVWLEKRGATGGARVKILDFGLARAVADESHLTQQGSIVGTPAYMAPEQARGDTVDERSDLFSLGCILYRMCTGGMPFPGKDAMSTLLAVAMNQPRPPIRVNPDVPATLDDLVLRLLAKDPSERPQSAQAVVDALVAIERQQAASAAVAPALRPDRTEKRAAALPVGAAPAPGAGHPRRKRFVAVAAALLIGAVALGAAVVIHLSGPKGEGTLTIETVDPDIEVSVKQGGKEVEVLDQKTHAKLTLGPGAYELELKGDKPGLKLVSKHIELRRGETKVATVTWDPGKAGARPAATGQRGAAEWVFSIGGGVNNLGKPEDLKDPVSVQIVYLHRDRCADRVTDDGLAHLEGLPDLHTLNLGGAQITGAGLAHLAGSKKLSWLSLEGSQVNDQGVAHLRGQDNLTYLNLLSTPITDQAVETLRQLTNLKTLVVSGTRMTRGGVEKLVSDLPDCQVVSDHQVPVPASEPLSPLALAARPARIKGVQSWTVETRGHRGAVSANGFSPDGRWLATGGADGSVRLWGQGDDHSPRVFLGHQGPVISVDWLPDGKTLVSGSQDRTLRFWDAGCGVLKHTIEIGPEPVFIALSRDGKYFAWRSADRTLRICDVTSEKVLHSANNVIAAAFSPDGKNLLFNTGPVIHLWAIESGKEVQTFKGHGNEVGALAWSPDGKRIASGSVADDTNRAWEVSSGKQLWSNRGGISTVSWSPDGKTVAAYATFGILLLETDSGKGMRELRTPYSPAFAWSADGKTLVSGAPDGTITFWDVGSGTAARAIPGQGGMLVASQAFSADSATVAVGVMQEGKEMPVRLWEMRTGRPSMPLQATDAISALVLPPDGTTPGSGFGRKDPLVNRAQEIWAAAWSPDGKTLATAHGAPGDLTVKLWTKGSNKPVRTLQEHKDWVYCLAWSPDGKALASGGRDKLVCLWDAASGKLLRTPLNGGGQVTALAWSPDGKTLASAGYEGPTIQLWDTGSGERLKALEGHKSSIFDLRWMPDGTTLASSSTDNTLRLWDTRTRQAVRAFSGVGAGTFSGDGRTLVGASSSGVRFWQTETGHLGAVLVFLPDNRVLAISPDGHFQGTPRVEEELVYVARTGQGEETLTPQQFAEKFGWKNDPGRVRLSR